MSNSIWTLLKWQYLECVGQSRTEANHKPMFDEYLPSRRASEIRARLVKEGFDMDSFDKEAGIIQL